MAGDVARSGPGVRRWIILFVALQLGALGSIVIAGFVSDDAILDALTEDFATGRMTAEWPHRVVGDGISGRFGECYLAAAGYDDGTLGGFERVMGSPTFGECEPLLAALRVREEGFEPFADVRYRYWHGLQVMARPLIAIDGIVLPRVLAVVAFGAAFVALARQMRRLGGWAAAVGFGAPLLLTGDPITLLDAFHHPTMLAVGFATTAALMARSAAGRADTDLAFWAVAAGALYNFVDLLNFVPGVWLLMGGAVVLARPAGTALADRIRAGVAVELGWAAGYAGMWVMAWVWAAVATSPSTMWDDVTGKIAYRVAGESEATAGGFGAGLLEVGRWWFARPAAGPLIVALLAVGVIGLVRLRHDRPALLAVVAATASISLTFPWMLLAGQHHETHDWFEFRSLPILLGLVLAAIAVAHTGRFSTSDA